MRAFTFHEIVDGRLDAAVVALDVGDVFHRVGEDDAEPGERVDDCCRAALGAVSRNPRGEFHAELLRARVPAGGEFAHALAAPLSLWHPRPHDRDFH